MGRIIRAFDGNTAQQSADPRHDEPPDVGGAASSPLMSQLRTFPNIRPPALAPDLELDDAYLRRQRIIAHVRSDKNAKAYDMLRTPVLQAMDAQDWRFLAVTSPTPACGTTSTAINLALSIARNFEREVMLVDLNLGSPAVAGRLGIEPTIGLASVLRGDTALEDGMLSVRIGSIRFVLLPTETPLPDSSEWMASRAMASVLQTIRRDYPQMVVIFDLPAVLASDDALAFLPLADCTLLVASAGITSTQQIIESGRHLQTANLVRVVVNKVGA